MNRLLMPSLMLLLLISSCTVYREYRIEVYKPGEIITPPPVKNAALVYRNFKYPGDTLQNYYQKGNQLVKTNNALNTDSLMADACLNELAISLKSHNIFSEVPVLPYQTFEKHTQEKLTNLPVNIVTQLIEDANAQALISLETFSQFFSTYPETAETPLTNEVVTVAVWGIYTPGIEMRIERKTMIDTIFWNGYDNEGKPQQNYRPPPRLKALELASAMAGESFSKKFYAGWQSESRMYVIPPLPDFEDAAVFLLEGKWDNAIALWQKYTADTNGKMAIAARYNLALAYEMKDNFDIAWKWLSSAHQLAKSYRSKNDLQMVQLYQKTLSQRIKEKSYLESR